MVIEGILAAWVVLLVMIGLVAWPRLQAADERVVREPPLARRARCLDASPIAEAPELQNIRVVGEVVRPDGEVVAPMTLRPCAFWRLEVSVGEYSPVLRTWLWSRMFETTDGPRFALASSNGECRVDPSLAVLAMQRDQVIEITSSRKLSARLRSILEHAGVAVATLPRCRLRFEESMVAFGARVALFGAGRTSARPARGSADTGYRDVRPTWLCFSGADDELLVTDAPELLGARGTGGGIRVEPPRPAHAPQPSRTATWAALDVDEFERRIAVKRRRVGAAVVAAGMIGTGLLAAALLSDRRAAQPAVGGDPCDLSPLMRDYTARGARSTRGEFALFDAYCPHSLPYRRLRFDEQRQLGDVRGAALAADALIDDEPGRADLWLALAAERGAPDLLRQAAALPMTEVERHEARATLAHMAALDAETRCALALVDHALGGDAPAADCGPPSGGHAVLPLGAPGAARIGAARVVAALDAQSGTTIVSMTLANGLGLEATPTVGMTFYAGHVVRGRIALVPSISLGATHATNLRVVIGDLPREQDVVIGADYLWRFSRNSDASAIELQ